MRVPSRFTTVTFVISMWLLIRMKLHPNRVQLSSQTNPSLLSMAPQLTTTYVTVSQDLPTITSSAEVTQETQIDGDGKHLSDLAGTVDGVIVMAKLQKEDTNWVGEHLPEWKNAIYTVDNTSAPLYTSVNKGKESMVYLTYIIDNYFTLPETLVFLHSHRDGYPTGWHTDAPEYDNVNSVRMLKLDFVQRSGYVNLRCIWIPGCPDEIQPYREQYEEHREPEHATRDAWRYIFNNTDIPSTIGVACCSQFAVSRDQVRARPLEDYQRYRQWLLDTELSDEVSGRVFEYFWHIIFGKESVQ
ncbi:hypothetical protein GP486_002210 [Trichoglossum hirsutum]|uniref:Uncharacterized protein n=1 Tax=Trichoglossum hirsutum TaxID=265104 RepID=A0A9P8RRX1_9PEZI|nr:hypothetical protein GP486_002210 [Trichoglossum hirsutum]